MALGHEDVAVGGDQDVVGLPEKLRIPPAARLAERHEELAVRAELVDQVSLGAARGDGGVPLRGAAGAGAIGHPDVAVPVHEDAVRGEKHPGAEALHHGAGRIELEAGIESTDLKSTRLNS